MSKDAITEQLEIGNRIHRLREDTGMTQIQLAEKMGITRQAISNWENGKALPKSNATLMKLSHILGCETGYLTTIEQTSPTRILTDICSETGLSELAAKYLQQTNNNCLALDDDVALDFINHILESAANQQGDLLKSLKIYREASKLKAFLGDHPYIEEIINSADYGDDTVYQLISNQLSEQYDDANYVNKIVFYLQDKHLSLILNNIEKDVKVAEYDVLVELSKLLNTWVR